MRYRFYLDTSVLGALVDRLPPGRAEPTLRLLDWASKGNCAACVSGLVLEEIARAPENIRSRIEEVLGKVAPEILEETQECRELADSYVAANIFSPSYLADARHVAMATVSEVDALVSWNYRHMVNLDKKRLITATNLMRGYRPLEIITPSEVIGNVE